MIQKTFENYFTLNKSMDFETIRTIYQDILSQANTQYGDFQWIWQDFIN